MKHFEIAITLAVLGLVYPSKSTFAAERQVSVSGVCNKSVTPDRGAITLTVEARNSDLKAAIKKATDVYEGLREAVKKLGLENLDLKTSEYSVNEIREWEKDRQVMKGYRARMGVLVETSSIQRLGEVIALGARHQVNDVGQLQIFLSPQKLQKEQFECLQAAAENARAKAEKLASALGAKVGKAVSISESGGIEPPRPPRPMRMEMAMQAKGSMPEPQVEAGQQEMSLTVQATFELQ